MHHMNKSTVVKVRLCQPGDQIPAFFGGLTRVNTAGQPAMIHFKTLPVCRFTWKNKHLVLHLLHQLTFLLMGDRVKLYIECKYIIFFLSIFKQDMYNLINLSLWENGECQNRKLTLTLTSWPPLSETLQTLSLQQKHCSKLQIRDGMVQLLFLNILQVLLHWL